VTKFLRLLVSGLLLGWLAWRTDWSQVGDAFANLRPDYWLAALGLYLATQLASSLRWQLLARPLGFELPVWRYAGFYFVGMFFNLFLPTSVGGDVLRAWYLDGGSGRRLKAFLSVFVDRLSGLLVLLTGYGLNKDRPSGNNHTFFFIPVEAWGVIIFVYGIVASLSK